MIQRKQSALLALAAILLFLLFFFPLMRFEMEDNQIAMMIYGLSDFDTRFLPLIFFNVISAFLIIGIIFLYKRRNLQIKLCILSTLILTGYIVAIFYFEESVKSYPEIVGYTSEIGYGIVAPLASLVLVILANRFIKKDEELVRSANRLR